MKTNNLWGKGWANNVWGNTVGWRAKGDYKIDFIQYLETLARISKKAEDDGNSNRRIPKGSCLVYDELIARNVANDKLKSITFSFVQELATSGNGGSGFYN